MNYAQERHCDAIDDAAAELMRRVRAGCAGKKGLPSVLETARKLAMEAKQVVAADE